MFFLERGFKSLVAHVEDVTDELGGGVQDAAKEIEDGIRVAASIGDNATDASLAFLSQVKDDGEDTANAIISDSRKIIAHTVHLAAQQSGEAYQELVKINNELDKFGSELANGVEELSEEIVDQSVAVAKKGYEATKEYAESFAEELLIPFVDRAARESKPLLKKLEKTIDDVKEAGSAANKLGTAIKKGKPKEIILNLLKLLKEMSSLDLLVDKIKDKDAGSVVMYVTFDGALVFGVASAFGIAINIDVYIYLAKNAEKLYNQLKNNPNADVFEDFDESILALVSVVGGTVGIQAGATIGLAIGYHVNDPDGVPGPAIDMNASFALKAGVSIAAGLDPCSGFPPPLVQLIAGTGVGLDAGVSVGASYCSPIARLHCDGKFYMLNQKLPPSRKAAKRHEYPDVFWHKFSWSELGRQNQNMWRKLGFGKANWGGPKSSFPGAYDTHWDHLTPDQRDTAESLGFSLKTWVYHDYPSGHLARTSANHWDYWKDIYWSDLGENVQREWKKLGWSSVNWDHHHPLPKSYTTCWQDLTARERLAANILGFTPSTWCSTQKYIIEPMIGEGYLSHLSFFDQQNNIGFVGLLVTRQIGSVLWTIADPGLGSQCRISALRSGRGGPGKSLAFDNGEVIMRTTGTGYQKWRIVQHPDGYQITYAGRALTPYFNKYNEKMMVRLEKIAFDPKQPWLPDPKQLWRIFSVGERASFATKELVRYRFGGAFGIGYPPKFVFEMPALSLNVGIN